MAMNKAEKEIVEQLKLQLSLRWTQPVDKDVPVPTEPLKLSKGFMFLGTQGDFSRVQVACSSSCSHSVGQNDKTISQRGIELFSTRILALKAMRHEVEKHCAYLLRRVDKQIEEETAKSTE